MKKLFAVAAVLGCMMLSGCSVYQPEVESLLTAPLLSEVQNHVDEALRDVVGQDIKLKYPVSGEHRSPYIFYDLDGDSEEEALVLYSLENDTDVTYLQILTRSEDGWRAGSALPGSGSEIEFVQFAHLTMPDQINIVIGWKDADTATNYVTVYRCQQEKPVKLAEAAYSQIALSDFDADGADELLVALASPGGVQLQLMGSDGSGAVAVLDSATTPQRMVSLLSPVLGEVQPGMTGAVLDGMISSDCMASLLVGVQDGHLRLPQNESGAQEDLFSATYRYTGVRSEDVNRDGLIDIPTGTIAAGYTGNAGELSSQYFTLYHTFSGSSFLPMITTYENLSNGYRLILPEAWMPYYEQGTLSVYRQAETREVSFFLYEGSLTDRTKELLRLRVVSEADNLSESDSARYTLLATRRQFRYYAYLPAADGLPSLTTEKLQSCFALLNQ